MLNIRLLFEINIHYISIYQPTYPFKQSFAFFSGLHCDAVWTNSWWHFHAGLQLPAVCCAGLCHRALQLWWQNRLWITERSPFVYSHWNQNATRPRSNQNNLWLHLQRFLWWAPITNDGPLNVTIPAAALSPPWACDSLQDWETKIGLILSSDLARHRRVLVSVSVTDTHLFKGLHWLESYGFCLTPQWWRCTNIIKRC